MAHTLKAELGAGLPLLPQKSAGQAKVSDPTPRKAQNWADLAYAMDYARRDARLTIKEFAAALDRTESQVRAWINGTERPQLELVLAVPRFKSAAIIGLAKDTEDLEVETLIRRRA